MNNKTEFYNKDYIRSTKPAEPHLTNMILTFDGLTSAQNYFNLLNKDSLEALKLFLLTKTTDINEQGYITIIIDEIKHHVETLQTITTEEIFFILEILNKWQSKT